MPLEISVSGPGLLDRRVIEEGQSLLIGRDTDCGLCLPDPERTVSRQHLVVWVEAGQLQLRVLSAVNAVGLGMGEVPPGGVAALPHGQVLMVGDYDITVREVDGPFDASLEASFDAPDSSIVGATGHGGAGTDDDPFGEWGFDAAAAAQRHEPLPELMPPPPERAPIAVGEGMSGDAAAFFRGLGLDPARLTAMRGDELEAAGRKVRVAIQGLMDLSAAKLDLSREMGADERTIMAARENNPLKSDWPLDVKLEYLLAGRSAGAAFAPPEKALADVVSELRIHDAAVTAASRAVLEGALREFEPARLQERFGQEGAQAAQGLMARLRPWDAYTRYYAGQSARMAHWLERLFNRYFTPAYTRETTRIKRGDRRE